MRLAGVIAIAVALGATAFAARAVEGDLEGAKDHPMVQRFPGSVIGTSVTREFEEFVIEKWQSHFNGVRHVQTLTCQHVVHKKRLHPQIDNQAMRRTAQQILAPVELFEKLSVGISPGELLSEIGRDQRIKQAEFFSHIVQQVRREGEHASDSLEPW